jgi:hypothetical protein
VVRAGQEELQSDALAADHVCRSEAQPCNMAVGSGWRLEGATWQHDNDDDDGDASMAAEGDDGDGDGRRWMAMDGCVLRVG